MLKTTNQTQTSEVKRIKFVAVKYWMLEIPDLSNLELYLFGAIDGFTQMYEGWNGTIEKLISFLQLDSRPASNIEDALNHLNDMGLITVKELKANTYEIKAVPTSHNPEARISGGRINV